MRLEVTNLNIGEKIIINTEKWDFADIKVLRRYSDAYLIISYNNWEYQIHAVDFKVLMAKKTALANAIGC